MTLITAYVRAGLSGSITGLDTYCPSPTHHACRESSLFTTPVDIGGPGDVYLRVNYPNVASIRTTRSLSCCGGISGCPDVLKSYVTVELYGRSNGQCFIGTVGYGHIENPVSDGLHNLLSGEFKLGTASPDHSCICSTGSHSHMEQKGGSRLALTCGQVITTSTNIFSFQYDSVICMT